MLPGVLLRSVFAMAPPALRVARGVPATRKTTKSLQEYGELADELTNKAEDPASKFLDVL
jgi:hypothetical protein